VLAAKAWDVQRSDNPVKSMVAMALAALNKRNWEHRYDIGFCNFIVRLVKLQEPGNPTRFHSCDDAGTDLFPGVRSGGSGT
jgi:hypothetical protein